MCWTRPNASGCIRMYPNASETVRMGPNGSERVQAALNTSKNLKTLAKTLKNVNFAKIWKQKSSCSFGDDIVAIEHDVSDGFNVEINADVRVDVEKIFCGVHGTSGL